MIKVNINIDLGVVLDQEFDKSIGKSIFGHLRLLWGKNCKKSTSSNRAISTRLQPLLEL